MCGGICVCARPCLHVSQYGCMPMVHMLTSAWGVHVGMCTKMCVATVGMLTHASYVPALVHVGNAQICAQWRCMCSPMPTRIYVHACGACAFPCLGCAGLCVTTDTGMETVRVPACAYARAHMCVCDACACAGPAHMCGAHTGALQWCVCSPMPIHVPV